MSACAQIQCISEAQTQQRQALMIRQAAVRDNMLYSEWKP